MARLCEPCRFHSAADALKECPHCGGAVKFTLLPPPGEEAKPMPGLRSVASQREAVSKNRQLLAYGVGGVILVLILIFGFGAFAGLGQPFESRVMKIKVGMPMAQAAKIMGESDQPKRKKFSITFGGNGGNGDDESRIPDFNKPADYSGSGYADFTGGSGLDVRINYENGIVTGIVPIAHEGGMRKRTTIYTP